MTIEFINLIKKIENNEIIDLEIIFYNDRNDMIVEITFSYYSISAYLTIKRKYKINNELLNLLISALNNNHSITKLNIDTYYNYTVLTQIPLNTKTFILNGYHTNYKFNDINLLLNNLQNNETLTNLKLCRIKIDDIKFINLLNDFIKNNNSIIKLELNCINLEYKIENIQNNFSLSEGLIYNKNITSLNLINCRLKNSCGELFKILQNNNSITSLNLSRNNIESITDLANCLKVNTTLTDINLSENGILDISDLSNSLQINTTLTDLNLSYNDIIDISDLSNSLQINTTLTDLNLSHNNIKNIINLTDNLKENNNITKINLSNNLIDDIKQIDYLLKYNSSLYSLNISYNLLLNNSSDKDLQLFFNNLKYNNTLTKLNIKANYSINRLCELSIYIYELLKVNNTLIKLKYLSDMEIYYKEDYY